MSLADGEQATGAVLHLLALRDGRWLLVRATFTHPAEVAETYPGARHEAGPLDAGSAAALMRKRFGDDMTAWPFSPEAIARLVREGQHALLTPGERSDRSFVHAQRKDVLWVIAFGLAVLGSASVVMPRIAPNPGVPTVMPFVGAALVAAAILVVGYRSVVVADCATRTAARRHTVFGLRLAERVLSVDAETTVLLRTATSHPSASAPSRPSTHAVVALATANAEEEIARRSLDGTQQDREKSWTSALDMALELGSCLGIPVRWAGPGSSVAGHGSWVFPLLEAPHAPS